MTGMESEPTKHAFDEDEEPSQTPAQLSTFEAQPGGQGNELSDLRARLTAYEMQLRQLAGLLSEAQTQLANKRELLTWIVNSRSWKITSWLRHLNFINQRMRPGIPRSGQEHFSGSLEKPVGDSIVSGHLKVSGWTYSTAAPIKSVEAFLDNIPLGKLEYGQARPDVASYPSQAPLNCGYQGEFLIDESFQGSRVLAIRVTDGRGHLKDERRAIMIKDSSAPSILSGFKIASEAGGGQADEAMNPLLRDDLSTAKRLLTISSKIALDSFLISDSTLVFPGPENPQVSIILVLYNRAELTLQSLYSILKDNQRSYEVIIVDNASTDKTGQLLRRIEGARIIRNETNVHYLLACNQAGRLARGEYLLLLNNDAQIQGNSLASALETLTSAADIGAVGGKIVLPDGTLQEAGSIIWQDGSCLGYGRGDSPFAPAYMFKRDVDYCSAAFLLTKRELFMAGGGFDEAYVPAYYEETDYCVRLWKQGQRVVYDPNVTILHYEFASSGSSRSAIDLQARHRKIFVSRHEDWLRSQRGSSPEHTLAARTHQERAAKKILYLDDRVPHLTLGSGFPRSNRIIHELVLMGHLVTCYPLDFPQEDWLDVYQDIPREVEVMINLGRLQLERFLMERADYYDVLFISRPHNAAILKAVLNQRPELCSRATIIYDAEALFTLRDIEKLRLAGKKLSAQARQTMIDKEIKLAEGCHHVISVSENESREFTRYGFERVHTLGHALTPAPTRRDFAARRDILFVGAIHTPQSPNADSVLWFSKSILPKIQKKLGDDVQLILAGPIHADVAEQLARKSVRIEGAVKDLTDLYDRSRIFVAPTRFSAGIPHKVHEAAAHGLPLVATPLIGTQLGWHNEEELLLADDEEGFAAACARLYEDERLWHQLRENALRRVEKDCSPALFAETLREIISSP